MRCGVKDCGVGSVRVAVIIEVVINGGYGSISMVLILVVVVISARVVMVVFCFVLVCRLRSGLEAGGERSWRSGWGFGWRLKLGVREVGRVG